MHTSKQSDKPPDTHHWEKRGLLFPARRRRLRREIHCYSVIGGLDRELLCWLKDCLTTVSLQYFLKKERHFCNINLFLRLTPLFFLFFQCYKIVLFAKVPLLRQISCWLWLMQRCYGGSICGRHQSRLSVHFRNDEVSCKCLCLRDWRSTYT